MLANTLFTILTVASPLSQEPCGNSHEVELGFAVRLESDTVVFSFDGQQQRFFAGVLLSLGPDLERRRLDLPYTLADSVLYGVGTGSAAGYSVAIADTLLPPGMPIYAQGLMMIEDQIHSSPVDGFVLDATGGMEWRKPVDDRAGAAPQRRAAQVGGERERKGKQDAQQVPSDQSGE